MCPLCDLYFCDACSLSFVLDNSVTVRLCKKCKVIAEKVKKSTNIKHKLEEAGNHPLALYCGVIRDLVAFLTKTISTLDLLVSSCSNITDIKKVDQQEQNLISGIRSFNKVVTKVKELQLTSRKDRVIQHNLLVGLSNFLKDNLAVFRTFQRQRKELIAEFEKANTTINDTDQEINILPIEKEVTILSIEPAVCGMDGAEVTLTAEGIGKNIQVLVDDFPSSLMYIIEEKGKSIIHLRTPPMHTPGLKTVQLFDLQSGLSATHQNVLFYYEEENKGGYRTLGQHSEDKNANKEKDKTKPAPFFQGYTRPPDPPIEQKVEGSFTRKLPQTATPTTTAEKNRNTEQSKTNTTPFSYPNHRQEHEHDLPNTNTKPLYNQQQEDNFFPENTKDFHNTKSNTEPWGFNYQPQSTTPNNFPTNNNPKPLYKEESTNKKQDDDMPLNSPAVIEWDAPTSFWQKKKTRKGLHFGF